MPYRHISTDTWHDPWFESLTRDLRYLFFYLVTNEYCNQAGLYQVSPRRMSFDTLFTVPELDALLPRLRPKVIWQPDWIWITNFLRYQCANPSFRIAAIRQAQKAPIQLFQAWTRHNDVSPQEIEVAAPKTKVLSDTVSTPCPHPGDTVSTPCPHDSYSTEQNSTVSVQSRGEEPHTEPAGSARRSAPFDEIQKLFNRICTDLGQANELTEKRKRSIQSRYTQHPDLAWWEAYFRKIHASDFLNRRSGKDFMANFDWVLNPSNMTKILEGYYDNRPPADPLDAKAKAANAKDLERSREYFQTVDQWEKEANAEDPDREAESFHSIKQANPKLFPTGKGKDPE